MDRPLYVGRYIQSFAARARPAIGMVAFLDPRRYIKRHIVQIPEIHWRAATCEEAGCPSHEFGWKTIVSAQGPQAEYIRHGSERRFREIPKGEGLVEFQFYPGQTCFNSDKHRVQTGEAPLLAVGRRDGAYALQEGDRWTGEFNEETFQVGQARKQGSYTNGR
jgi:hypothetical protein